MHYNYYNIIHYITNHKLVYRYTTLKKVLKCTQIASTDTFVGLEHLHRTIIYYE